MITPIWTMKISEIVERHEDLLVSADDIKELAKNERVKAIEEFAEAVKAEIFPMLHTEEEYAVAEKALDDIENELKGE